MKKWVQTMVSLTLGVILTVIPVFGAVTVDNDAVYPITTNEISQWPQGEDVHAETAILMDADTGAILYNKGMDEIRYPASITKIMTALLALENSSLDEEVTFTEECLADQTWDSTNAGMQVGEVLTMEQCIYVMMLASANDVATQIAIQVSGSVSAFADKMNQRAKELGCQNTHFVNASGMPDEDHYTTAHDMARIFQEAIKNETFMKVIQTQSYTLEPTNKNSETRTYNTHHVMTTEGAEQYYKGCFGGKTGGSTISKNTLVSGAVRKGMTLIAVAMRADIMDIWQDHATLFDYGYDNFQKVEVEGGSVTIPKGVEVEDLTTEVNEEDQDLVDYYYQGEYVGQGIQTAKDQEETLGEDEENMEDMNEASTEDEKTTESSREEKNSRSLQGRYHQIILVLSGLVILALLLLIVSIKKGCRK